MIAVNVPGKFVRFGINAREHIEKWESAPLRDDRPARAPKMTRGTVSFAAPGLHSRTTHLMIAQCRGTVCQDNKIGERYGETAVGRVIGSPSMQTLDALEEQGKAGYSVPPLLNSMVYHEPPDTDVSELYLNRVASHLSFVHSCKLLQLDTGGQRKLIDEQKQAVAASKGVQAEKGGKNNSDDADKDADQDEDEDAVLEQLKSQAEADAAQLYEWQTAELEKIKDTQPAFSETVIGRHHPDGPCPGDVRTVKGDSLQISFNVTVAAGSMSRRHVPFKIAELDKQGFYADVGDEKSWPFEGMRRAFIGACVGEERVVMVPSDLAYGAAGVANAIPPVPGHAPLKVMAQIHAINGWDGAYSTPEPPADLLNPPAHIADAAKGGSCTVHTGTGKGELLKVLCRMAYFGPNAWPKGSETAYGLWVPGFAAELDDARAHEAYGCKGSLAKQGDSLKDKVVMLKRGKCPFYEKYIEAAQYQPRAVLIADNQPFSIDSGLIGLTRGTGVEADPAESAAGAPICASISMDMAEKLSDLFKAALQQKSLLGFSMSFPEKSHRDHYQRALMSRQLIAELTAQRKREPESPLCGGVPRLALNAGVAAAKVGLYDDAMGMIQAALHAADDCAAAAGAAKDGDTIALTKSERQGSYGMLAELFSEWGHIKAALDACNRARAIVPGAACKAETRVRCDTTKGDFELSIFRLAAPFGADRFIDFVRQSFYNESAFHRVTADLAQFGFASTPQKQREYVHKYPKLDDDINVQANVDRGVITFHGHGQKSRHSAVFIAKKFVPLVQPNDHFRRYENDWHRAFGYVTRGMDVIDNIFVTGDMERDDVDPSVKQGPNMLQVQLVGNKYLEKEFPGFDRIKHCEVID